MHHLRKLKNCHLSDPSGGVDWKQVVPAARHSKVAIMKPSLSRRAEPMWDGVKVKQLSYNVEVSKTEEWGMKYEMLVSECGMQQYHHQYEIQQRLAD